MAVDSPICCGIRGLRYQRTAAPRSAPAKRDHASDFINSGARLANERMHYKIYGLAGHLAAGNERTNTVTADDG